MFDVVDHFEGQLKEIFDIMTDGKWRTIDQLAAITGIHTQSISARLRDYRKPQFGNHTVNKRPLKHTPALIFEYQLILRMTQ